MRKKIFLFVAIAMCLASCLRVTEVTRDDEPSEPSDTTIVDGWQEVDNNVDLR